MSYFKTTYKLTDGKVSKGNITGPPEATEEACLRVLKLAASNYQIDPESIAVETQPERLCKGFLHQLEALTPEGRTARVTGWYY